MFAAAQMLSVKPGGDVAATGQQRRVRGSPVLGAHAGRGAAVTGARPGGGLQGRGAVPPGRFCHEFTVKPAALSSAPRPLGLTTAGVWK